MKEIGEIITGKYLEHTFPYVIFNTWEENLNNKLYDVYAITLNHLLYVRKSSNADLDNLKLKNHVITYKSQIDGKQDYYFLVNLDFIIPVP